MIASDAIGRLSCTVTVDQACEDNPGKYLTNLTTATAPDCTGSKDYCASTAMSFVVDAS